MLVGATRTVPPRLRRAFTRHAGFPAPRHWRPSRGFPPFRTLPPRLRRAFTRHAGFPTEPRARQPWGSRAIPARDPVAPALCSGSGPFRTVQDCHLAVSFGKCRAFMLRIDVRLTSTAPSVPVARARGGL
jgi:hypothetical protein